MRNVIVKLHLPAIATKCSAEILKVTLSYSSSSKRTTPQSDVPLSETLTLWRTADAEILEEEEDDKLAAVELQTEEARLHMAEMIKKPRTMADNNMLLDAQNKLVEAQNMLVEQSDPLLKTELQELFDLLETQETYEKQGRPYALSSESSHARQHFAARGGDLEIMRLFATPCMDKYMEHANKFLNKPTTTLPSAVDDDVKEEVANLTIN